MSDISEGNSMKGDFAMTKEELLAKLLEDKICKNDGRLYSSDIAEAFNLAGYEVVGKKTGAIYDLCKLDIKDEIPGTVRIRELGPKSVFDWLSDPLMIARDQSENLYAVNLRSGYLHRIYKNSRNLLSEDTLVHPVRGEFIINY